MRLANVTLVPTMIAPKARRVPMRDSVYDFQNMEVTTSVLLGRTLTAPNLRFVRTMNDASYIHMYLLSTPGHRALHRPKRTVCAQTATSVMKRAYVRRKMALALLLIMAVGKHKNAKKRGYVVL